MIQQQRLPLSPPDKEELEKIIKLPGFQRLKELVLAHGAEHATSAAMEMITEADGGINKDDEIAKARMFHEFHNFLVQIETEEGSDQLFKLQLTIKP